MSILASRVYNQFRQRGFLFVVFALILAISVAAYLMTGHLLLLGIPAGLAAIAWGIRDFSILYLAIWATIPFAVEVDLPGGLSTDFPAEPLMWLTFILFPVYIFLQGRQLDFSFLFHPLMVILVIHFFWIVLMSAISTVPLISIKYTLAKTWYLVCFVVVPLVIFRHLRDFKTWSVVFLVPLVLTVIIILIRHSQYGFTFSTINNAVIPIYRNHVDYACSLGVFLPFTWWISTWVGAGWKKYALFACIAIVVTGIYFSYTRAAWLCIPLAGVVYFLIRLRWMRVIVPLVLAVVLLVVGWLAYDNHYISYSPNYESVITQKKFDDLVSATYRMEDISTVERFYRWVAGYYMLLDRPWTGFGPASFYSVYHSFVDRHFTTYVSDNPEQSGMHNYYLMVAVEQGIPGLVIFLSLVILVLIWGERLYYKLQSGVLRNLLMAGLISLCCNLFILTLNDTVETDKLGAIFFLCIGIVIWVERNARRNGLFDKTTLHH